MKRIDWLAALLAALLLTCATHPVVTKLYAAEEPEALCTTDTDCAKHCPPPNDDPDCDGGPQ
jgi:hypothetical protein